MAKGEQKLSVSRVQSMIQKEGLRWAAGDTTLSKLSLSQQRQHLGLLVTEEEIQQSAAEVAQLTKEEMKAFEVGLQFGAPTSKDWRNVNGNNYVTSVKDQGPCGSCVSFCSCAVIEANMRIKSQNPNLDVDLSEAFLQFCGGGSCNGWGLTSGLEFAKTTGVTDDACFPYQPQDLPCNNRCSDWQSRVTKILSYSTHASMQARKDAIANIGPVLGGMAVYNDFFSYSSGIYQKTSGASLAGYHCITIVGYDDSQQCWILKNSWGSGWGDNGYVRIAYNQPDLLIDSSWAFYSVDPDVEPTQDSGTAQYVLVDKVFGGAVIVWAYAGGSWRHRYISDGDLTGVAQVLFAASRVDVWWDGDEITLIRPWKSFS
jgi:C1A family cysteine protease